MRSVQRNRPSKSHDIQTITLCALSEATSWSAGMPTSTKAPQGLVGTTQIDPCILEIVVGALRSLSVPGFGYEAQSANATLARENEVRH